MELYRWPLKSKYRTVREIKNSVSRFARDLEEFPELMKMSILQYYNYVKTIPYIRDARSAELVSRPKYLLSIFPALDCKKKSILMASFMRLKYGPDSYRYVLSSNRPDGKISHIFTQFYIDGKWINADATYPHNAFGAKKKVTNFEIVKG